jgi:hypothetical protein
MSLFPQSLRLLHKDTDSGQARARREAIFAESYPQRKAQTRAYFKNDFRVTVAIAQGLTPFTLIALFGTDKVVP